MSSYSGVVQLQRVVKNKLSLARRFRRKMTTAEAQLWSQLRGKNCNGLKFRRQQVIDGFIADFFCAEKNLVVEVDGPVHENTDRKAADHHRRKVFEMRGIRELRFTNKEVIENVESVMVRIMAME